MWEKKLPAESTQCSLYIPSLLFHSLEQHWLMKKCRSGLKASAEDDLFSILSTALCTYPTFIHLLPIRASLCCRSARSGPNARYNGPSSTRGALARVMIGGIYAQLLRVNTRQSQQNLQSWCLMSSKSDGGEEVEWYPGCRVSSRVLSVWQLSIGISFVN